MAEWRWAQLDADNLESFLVAHGGGRRFSGKAEKGKENPFSCLVLHGGRQHAERKRNLAAFKEGDVRFLVCTDVAARGLDIAGKNRRLQTTFLAGLGCVLTPMPPLCNRTLR